MHQTGHLFLCNMGTTFSFSSVSCHSRFIACMWRRAFLCVCSCQSRLTQTVASWVTVRIWLTGALKHKPELNRSITRCIFFCLKFGWEHMLSFMTAAVELIFCYQATTRTEYCIICILSLVSMTTLTYSSVSVNSCKVNVYFFAMWWVHGLSPRAG